MNISRAETAINELLGNSPGTYMLGMRLEETKEIQIGALGIFAFAPGYYLYVGSALNGLAGRLTRHARLSNKKLHWHIDYFRAQAALQDVWWVVSDVRWECHWVTTMGQSPVALDAVPGFGSSDCRCTSHLLHFPTMASLCRNIVTRIRGLNNFHVGE